MTISCLNLDFHSAAYWLAGRTVFSLNRGRTVGDLCIADPAAVLAAARADIQGAITAYLREPLSSNRRPGMALEIQSLMAGAESVRRGAARNADWSAAFGPLQAEAAAFMTRSAIVLVRDRWHDIQRLGRTLLAERKLDAEMVGWILNAPQKIAA
jgi:hypothetical protein